MEDKLNTKFKKFWSQRGTKNRKKIIKETIKNKIKYLTLYAFSTENWKRPKMRLIIYLNY